MVPRGGDCKSCKEYTLWGDVIRGCYRRMYPSEAVITDKLKGKIKSSLRRKKGARTRRCKSSKEKGKPKLRSSSMSKSRQNDTFDSTNLITNSESEDILRPVKRRPGRPRKVLVVLSPPTKRQPSSRGSGKRKEPASATRGENFASSENEDNATPMKRKRGRPRKVLAVLSPPTKRQPSSQGSGKRKQPANSISATPGEIFDFIASSENEENVTPMKRKRGRPHKNLAILSAGASSLVSSPKAPRKSKTSVSRAKSRLSSKGKGNQSSSSLSTSDGGTFDLNTLVTSLGSEATSTPMKRKRGRPPKDMSLG